MPWIGRSKGVARGLPRGNGGRISRYHLYTTEQVPVPTRKTPNVSSSFFANTGDKVQDFHENKSNSCARRNVVLKNGVVDL